MCNNVVFALVAIALTGLSLAGLRQKLSELEDEIKSELDQVVFLKVLLLLTSCIRTYAFSLQFYGATPLDVNVFYVVSGCK